MDTGIMGAALALPGTSLSWAGDASLVPQGACLASGLR